LLARGRSECMPAHEKSVEIFRLFFNGEQPTHPALAAFAFDPRAASGALHGTATPGTHCSLCRFPTYIFEPEPNNLGPDVLAAINKDFPQWTPSLDFARSARICTGRTGFRLKRRSNSPAGSDFSHQ
jgi:hypothetical protein